MRRMAAAIVARRGLQAVGERARSSAFAMWTEEEVEVLLRTPEGRQVFARWRARASVLTETELLWALEAVLLPEAAPGDLPGIGDDSPTIRSAI